jgi:hypothetical protein
MASHTDLWIAASAAAPVIALASIVSYNEVMKPFFEMVGSGDYEDDWISVLLLWASSFLSWCNILMQIAVLVISMVSLADESDYTSPIVAVVLTSAGLLLVFLNAACLSIYQFVGIFGRNSGTEADHQSPPEP